MLEPRPVQLLGGPHDGLILRLPLGTDEITREVDGGWVKYVRGSAGVFRFSGYIKIRTAEPRRRPDLPAR